MTKTTHPYVFTWPSFSPCPACAACRPSSCPSLSAPALPLALLVLVLVVLTQVQLLVQALAVLLALLLSLVPICGGHPPRGTLITASLQCASKVQYLDRGNRNQRNTHCGYTKQS
jgi:hypothetical protein